MKVHPTSRPTSGLAAVLFAVAALLAPANAAKPPHIVIVYAEELGPGDLSCYNLKAAYQTPRIDRMVAEVSALPTRTVIDDLLALALQPVFRPADLSLDWGRRASL